MYNWKLFNCFLTFFIVFNLPSIFSLSTLDEKTFDFFMDSHQPFAVLRLIKDKNNKTISEPAVNFKLLDDALPELQKHDVDLYIVSCEEKSKASLCEDVSKRPAISIFNKGRLVFNLKTESIESHQQLEKTILRYFTSKSTTIKEIKKRSDWDNLVNRNKENSFVFVHIETPRSSSILKVLFSSSVQFKNQISFAYSRDDEVVRSIVGPNFLITKDAVWLAWCPSNADKLQCFFYFYPHPVTKKNLMQTFKAMSGPKVTELAASVPPQSYQSLIDAALGDSLDVFLFAAGKLKQDKMRTLAESTCFSLIGHTRCIVVTGDLQSSKWFEHDIDESRIFLSIVTHQFYAQNWEGYLRAETHEEIFSYWNGINVLRQLVKAKDKEEDVLQEKDDVEDQDTVFDVQDDPVAHSVHNHKPLRDLYLFDHNSLPRLTDVTYDATMKSDKYAVVFFTLEFNAKSLAALYLFHNIHKKLSSSGGYSPLHRVECFDWPDVCAKANVTTFPRMFMLRPASGDRRSIEYTGAWKQVEMMRSIVLNSLPSLTMNPKEIPSSMDEVVYGLITSDQGDKTFRQVSAKFGHQYAFCLVRDLMVSNQLASSAKATWTGENALLIKSKGRFLEIIQPFQGEGHVIKSISEAFQPMTLTEMTELNFESLLNARVPLFLQFMSRTQTDADRKLSEMLLQISEAYKDKANFAWISTKEKSPGAYTLHLYSNGNPPPFPVAFISNEKTVSIKSFETLSNEAEMKQWVDQCLAGHAPVSYGFSTEVWTPRLNGYDYLSFMKLDNLIANHPPFPVKRSNKNEKNEEWVNDVVKSSLPPHSEL